MCGCGWALDQRLLVEISDLLERLNFDLFDCGNLSLFFFFFF